MDRRESLKALMVGTIAGATATTAIGCKENTPEVVEAAIESQHYGRTPAEQAWDENIYNEGNYFNEHEMTTIAVLCDIILPTNGEMGSATDAGVPEFVDFIVRDMPDQKLPMRGGLMWLDGMSNNRFNKKFVDCSNSEQLSLVDDIAYPDPDNKNPTLSPGIKFFNDIRNLTLTGYYTTKMGLKDLGYKGNVPNIWDGVPAEVLADHDVDYDPEWVAKCIDQDTREVIAEWDDDMNLIT